MIGWDIYDCHKCPSKNFKKIYKTKIIFYFLFFIFFGLGSLDPTYIRGVKHAGGAMKNTIVVSTMHLAKCMNC
jgi:hypothetical protein